MERFVLNLHVKATKKRHVSQHVFLQSAFLVVVLFLCVCAAFGSDESVVSGCETKREYGIVEKPFSTDSVVHTFGKLKARLFAYSGPRILYTQQARSSFQFTKWLPFRKRDIFCDVCHPTVFS